MFLEHWTIWEKYNDIFSYQSIDIPRNPTLWIVCEATEVTSWLITTMCFTVKKGGSIFYILWQPYCSFQRMGLIAGVWESKIVLSVSLKLLSFALPFAVPICFILCFLKLQYSHLPTVYQICSLFFFWHQSLLMYLFFTCSQTV